MHRSEYDITIAGEPIQDITSVAVLSSKYTRERPGDFTDSRLAAKLGSLSAGQLVLVSPEISGVTLQHNNPPAALHAIPELGYTRHESRRSVQFGQLTLRHAHRETAAELIAIKYTSPVLAAREFAAGLTVRSRMGAQHTYTPLGFSANTNPSQSSTGYIGRYRHEITTLDSVFWSEEASGEQRLQGAARAGKWLGLLHAHDIAHGDAQAKNIAHDSADIPLYPDLETAHDLRDQTIIPEIKALGDIADFLHFQDQALSRQEREAFIECYQEQSTAYVSAADIRMTHNQPLKAVTRYTTAS